LPLLLLLLLLLLLCIAAGLAGGVQHSSGHSGRVGQIQCL
jgi:hypothetical protein